MPAENFATETLQNAAGATGNGTAMQGLGDFSGVVAQVSGTFVATVTWEGTVNGTDWIAVRAQDLTSATKATTATTAGIFFLPTMGCTQFRARISAFTSGNVTVKARRTRASATPSATA